MGKSSVSFQITSHVPLTQQQKKPTSKMKSEAKRLAVVVGNSDYKNISKLISASNDAESVQKMFCTLGFEVKEKINPSREETLGMLDKWEYDVKEIVFYYSGRAVLSDDKLYLVPFDAETSTTDFLDMDLIINTLLERRKNNTIPIVIILSCYHSFLQSGDIGSHCQLQKVVQKNSNIAILYSMAEDEAVLGGNIKNKLSPYTYILLDNMEKNWTINQIHGAILNFVNNSDKIYGKMVLCLYHSLSESYRFCLPRIVSVTSTDLVKDPCHGVPSENQNFTDRPMVFRNMEAFFSKIPDLNKRRILALQGLGGVGKTQLMLKYYYNHRTIYDFAFWLEIDGRATAQESFRKLAINLGLGAKSAREKSADNSIIKWVSTWLEKKTKWLLLLNNADEEMTKEIFDDLPRLGGDIIMTTRYPVPYTKAETINISKMEENEAISLLYGNKDLEIDEKSVKYKNAKEIVSELDFLPLAVDLARAYIDSMTITFRDYLSMFRNQRERANVLLHRDEDNIHQYSHSLATVWKISFDRISQTPLSALILDACSFFKSENIPIGFFEHQYSTLKQGLDLSSTSPKGGDPSLIVSEAIRELIELSVVTEAKDKNNSAQSTLEISRLVQKVNFSMMKDERKIQLTKNISEALNNETEISDSYSDISRVVMNTYLPHIRHFSTLLEDFSRDILLSINLEVLLVRMVCYLIDHGIYIDVEAPAELAVSISISKYGEDNLSTTRALYSLAYFYHEKGTYEKAEPLYQKILDITLKVLGPMDIDTATALNNLASLYDNQGKLADAEFLYQQALRIAEKILPPEDLNTASYLNNMAVLYDNLGKHADAEQLYWRALVIRAKTLGPEHPTTADTLSDLASLFADQGKYTDAELLYQRALKIMEKALPQHAHTASSLNNLAKLYLDLNRYNDAEPLFKRAQEIIEKVFGPDDMHIASYLSDLGKLYVHQDRCVDAEPLFKRAHAIMEKEFGPDDVRTVSYLSDLEKLCLDSSKCRCRAIARTSTGNYEENEFEPIHLDTASYLDSLHKKRSD